MRRFPILIAIVLAAALVPAAQAKTKTMTITVQSQVRVSIPTDLPPKGKENKGDYLKYQSLLFNTEARFGKKKGVAVGWDKGTLTYLSATVARFSGAAFFPGQGSIKYKGVMKDIGNGNSSIRIVDGGGKFTGARGVLIIGPGNEKALNTFKFTLPTGAVA